MKLAVTLFGILLTAFTTILTYWSRTKFTQTQLARHPRLRKLFHRRQIQLSFVITVSVILSAICTAALSLWPNASNTESVPGPTDDLTKVATYSAFEHEIGVYP